MAEEKNLLKSANGRDIRMIINMTGLKIPDFSIRYGIPERTLQDWVGGKRKTKRYILDLLDFRVSYDVKNGLK